MNRIFALVALLALVGCRSTVTRPAPTPPPPEVTLYGGHVHDFPDLPLTIVKTDGSRPFTARIAGATPVGANDLATKGYVDSFASSDPELAAIAATTSAADKLPYFTGAGTGATTTFTAFARTLLDDANAAAAQATIGLAIGVDAQAWDADLDAIAGLTSAADKLPYFTGSHTAAVTTLTTFFRTLLDDTDASTALSTLGFSAFGKTMIDDADASASLSTLGFTAFTKTIVDDAGASDVRTTLGLGSAALQDAGNATFTIVAGSITGITDLALADGGTGTTLSDPNADRVMFWDDSAGHVEWLTMGTNLTITGTTLNAAGGSNALLDGSNHTDTDAGSPVAGDIIMGNATPHWAKLAKGTIYQKLGRGGTGSVASWIGDDAPVGGFWKLNPAANGTAQVIPFASSGGTVATYFVPIYSGTIRGISWTFTGTHTLGTITIRARKNGSAVTGLVYGPSGTTDLSGYTTANGDTFAAGDTLGLEYDTNAAWNGTAGQLVVTLWLGIDG